MKEERETREGGRKKGEKEKTFFFLSDSQFLKVNRAETGDPIPPLS